MKRRFLFLAATLLSGGILLSTCDLFSVPPADFESDSTIGTVRLTIPWVAPWVTSALGGSRAYLRISTITLELQDSEGAPVVSAVLHDPAGSGGGGAAVTLDWTVPIGDGYRLKADIANASSTPALVLSGISEEFSVGSGAVVPVPVTCLPVNPAPLTEDATSGPHHLNPNGEQWFTAVAGGTNTRFYCYAGESGGGYSGGADIWVFGPDGVFRAYGVGGAAADDVHLDTTSGQTYYVGVYNSSSSVAADFGVMFASTTMDLAVKVDSYTYSARKLTVFYTVTNTGVDTAKSFQVDLSDGGTDGASKRYNNIAPGTFSDSLKFSTKLTSGTISATIDPLSEVDESDEDNNEGSLVWAAKGGQLEVAVR